MDYINKTCMFISKVNRKLHIPLKLQRSFNAYRHSRIKKKLQGYFSAVNYNNGLTGENSKIIWVFWSQGYDKIPDVVSNCIKTIQENSGCSKVVLLTAKNFKQYANLPEWIVDKFESGAISPMYFSDALRFNLLKNYGGLWLDATDFVISPVTDKYFSDLCTVSGIPDDEHFFIAKGRWHTALFGGRSNHPLFQFMDSFFTNYWKDNDEPVDYFMTDYALDYAYQYNIGGFKEFIDSNRGKTDPEFVSLQPWLNDQFNEQKWKSLKKNTQVFKLTYKMNLSKKSDTFYSFIIEKYV